MKDNDNIEKVFKEKFEHFEADVNQQVWTNVQNGIKAGSGSAASSTGKLAVGKIIAGAASVAIIAGSIWYFSSSEENSTSAPAVEQVQSETAQNENISKNNISEEQAAGNNHYSENSNIDDANTPGSPMPPAIRSLNHYGSDHSQSVQSSSAASKKETGSDVPGSENSGNVSAQSKYGKASQGPTPLIRGNQSQNIKSKISKGKNAQDESYEDDQIPAVSIYASTESGDWPLTVQFSNLGVSNALSWDFGDGSTSRENTPSYTFDKPGTYTVKLVAQNSKGSNVDNVTIEVKSISEIDANNVFFTPNGDGNNDAFYFTSKNIASIEVVISNIGGGTVHRLNTVDGSWDGKLSNGNIAPTGRYFYSGAAKGKDGVVYPLKGSIDLR